MKKIFLCAFALMLTGCPAAEETDSDSQTNRIEEAEREAFEADVIDRLKRVQAEARDCFQEVLDIGRDTARIKEALIRLNHCYFFPAQMLIGFTAIDLNSWKQTGDIIYLWSVDLNTTESIRLGKEYIRITELLTDPPESTD